MAYVRKRGKQLVIVQGVREPDKGKVHQRILFTIFSKAEALQILGRDNVGHGVQFQNLLANHYPGLKLNWDKIYAGISEHLHVLPDLYQYKTKRLHSQFRKDLCSFARQLMLADPQDFVAAGNLIQEHRVELEYVADLIQWRLKLRKQEPNRWNLDNPFYWRFTLQGAGVPPDIEEHVADFYERGGYGRAKVLFRLLTECFDNYAEGYNYLGLISLHEEKLEDAVGHFQRVIEIGRKSFPSRIPRNRYWKDISTRPYMRGLMNLALTLNRAGRYQEALMICDRLEKECGEDISLTSYRAMVYLNTGRWQEAADSALKLHRVDPSESLVAALALHELGRTEHALSSFLHGALHFPRAARILSGARMKSPKNHDEADDHNTGIEIDRNLAEYLRGRGRRSRQFFRRVLNKPQVTALLDEMEKVKERRHNQHRSGEREAFDRMQHMQTPDFATQEARKVMESLETLGNLKSL